MNAEPQLDLSATEEPSDAAMSRLSDALDAAMSPMPPCAARGPSIGPDRAGSHSCLRCGHRWTPYLSTMLQGEPRCCPLCHSSFWDRPPKRPNARRPENTDWDRERAFLKAKYQRQARARRANRLVKVAAELGLAIVDPSTGRKTRRPDLAAIRNTPVPAEIGDRVAALEDRVKSFATTPTPAAVAASNDHVALDTEWLRRRAYGPTVPPPPGTDDSTNGDNK